MIVEHTSNLYQWRTRQKVTEYPTALPIDRDTLKNYLGIPLADTSQDGLLDMVIMSAVEIGQIWTGRYFIIHTIKLNLDHWPWVTPTESPIAHSRGIYQRYIELPSLPANEVLSITTYNSENAPYIIPSSSYIIDLNDENIWGRVVFQPYFTSPEIREASGIEIIYKAGYGANASDVPSGVVNGLYMLAAYLFENRGVCQGDNDCMMKSGANSLLNTYRVTRI